MDKITSDNLLKIVHDNYNQIAADFDMTRKKEIWPEMVKLSKQIKDGDSVLDLGCGNGRLLEALKDKQITYLGIDNSEELIKLAKQNYPNNKFLVSDILNLKSVEETKNKKFDHIFCLATLQHLPSKELRIESLIEMKKLLSEEGLIVLSNWNMWPIKKYRTMIFKSLFDRLLGKNKLEFGDVIFPWKNSKGEITSERYYHAFGKRELLSLCRKAGFSDVTIYKDRYNYWLILKK